MALTKIVNLHASWCNPCKQFEGTFMRVAKNDNNKDIQFERIDIESDEGTNYVEKYMIKSVPTTLLLDENNESIMKVMGAIPERDFQLIIDRNK